MKKMFLTYKTFPFFYPQSNLTHLPRNQFVPGIGLGIAKCPYDPLDNSTAIYVEKGNPGDLPGLVSILKLLYYSIAWFIVSFYSLLYLNFFVFYIIESSLE